MKSDLRQSRPETDPAPTVAIGARSGAMIARSRSRNSSALGSSVCSNSCRASTSAARIRLGLRPRHALVLQRGVQYFRVDRVSGNEVPHQLQTPISSPSLTTAANALINGENPARDLASDLSAARLRSVDQRFSDSRRCLELCAHGKVMPRCPHVNVLPLFEPWWRNW